MAASPVPSRARRAGKDRLKPYFSTRTVTLYNADCRDQLVDLPSASVDLLLTDPPYGMAYEGKGKSAAAIRADGSRQGMRVLRQALSAASAALAPDAHAYVFCHWESWPDFYDAVSAHLRIKGALVWWKNRGGMGDCTASYAPDYEVVLHAAGPKRRPLVGKRMGAVLAGYAPMPPQQRSCPEGGLLPGAGEVVTHALGAELLGGLGWGDVSAHVASVRWRRGGGRHPLVPVHAQGEEYAAQQRAADGSRRHPLHVRGSGAATRSRALGGGGRCAGAASRPLEVLAPEA